MSYTRYMPEVQKILDLLKKHYPEPEIELNYKGEMQLVIAVMLSAQTTDKKVNEITKTLFQKYPDWQTLASADPTQVQKDIYGVNYHKTKGERLVKTATKIVHDFNGKVPQNMKDLTSLPGIARKSANVILQELWGITEGIVVDTHIKRVSKRLGLTEETRPKKVEQDLMELLPKEMWQLYSSSVVLHGRYVCTARSPKCDECFLSEVCPSAFSLED
ncbi:endonuclease III [candidate division WWE3 bacterium]|nr:endonuclease III [candidate division WWE3 bacterium]